MKNLCGVDILWMMIAFMDEESRLDSVQCLVKLIVTLGSKTMAREAAYCWVTWDDSQSACAKS